MHRAVCRTWENIAAKFSIGGTKETAYTVFAALTDENAKSYNRMIKRAAERAGVNRRCRRTGSGMPTQTLRRGILAQADRAHGNFWEHSREPILITSGLDFTVPERVHEARPWWAGWAARNLPGKSCARQFTE
jgi:hypothetical protein